MSWAESRWCGEVEAREVSAELLGPLDEIDLLVCLGELEGRP